LAGHVTPRGKSPAQAPPPIKKLESRALEKLRGNTKGDWQIADIEAACEQVGMTCSPPKHGSHYKVSSPHLNGILTIPAKRPIKRCYIKQFIRLSEAHIKHVEDNGND
jgi:hypothetical protein